MIIKSLYPHIVGTTVYKGYITDKNGDPYTVPFSVLEEVTKEDYIIECKEQNKPCGTIFDNDHFYRVSVD